LFNLFFVAAPPYRWNSSLVFAAGRDACVPAISKGLNENADSACLKIYFRTQLNKVKHVVLICVQLFAHVVQSGQGGMLRCGNCKRSVPAGAPSIVPRSFRNGARSCGGIYVRS